MTFKLSMSPAVRLRMTVQREMELDREQKFYNADLYRRYLEMHRLAVTRQDSLAKALVIIDGALAFVLSGKSLNVPVINVALKDVPAAIEILTGLASFTFMVLALTFLTAQSYQAIIEQFNIRDTAQSKVDPEFLTAADVYTELSLKSFRAEMNFYRADFFKAGSGFRVYFAAVTFLLVMTFTLLLILHIALLGMGVWFSFNGTWLSGVFCAAAVLVNLVGILANLMIGFNFVVPDDDDNGGVGS